MGLGMLHGALAEGLQLGQQLLAGQRRRRDALPGCCGRQGVMVNAGVVYVHV